MQKHISHPILIRTLGLVVLGLMILVAIRVSAQIAETNAEEAAIEQAKLEQAAYDARFSNENYTVADGDVMAAILQNEVGLSYEEALEVVDAINTEHDVTKVRAGTDIAITYFDDTLDSLTYDISSDDALVITRADEEYNASIEPITYDIDVAQRAGTIETSFYNDGIEAGLTPRMIMELAKVFAFDVDFVNSIQDGDSFSVVYERLVRKGELEGTRDIIAARFTTNGKDFSVYRVIDDEGKTGYYSPDGGSSRRLLLKTPLNFTRISSNFGNRKHPISGGWKQHKGIDLAASTGTPVESVGSGTVSIAGWNGGYGKFVKIKHTSGYVTAYAHLSKINVTKGQQVEQGELIGAVGTTGSSTGPHLHYEMYFNDQLVHPFNHDTPKEEPLPEHLQPRLEKAVATYSSQIK